RTHSWMNCFRRVLTRWEKKTENYEAMLYFSCGLIVWNKILLG
ncbi:IS5/IS1182 family transposase, partial [Klebsiella michiganensis]